MSSKAARVTTALRCDAYDWTGQPGVVSRPTVVPTVFAPPVQPPAPAMTSTERATIERDAFGQGFAQGERAGAEAAAARSEAVLHRLKQTVEELQALRSEMIHKTERQVVQLAIAMARRIVHREITLDKELLTAMARVALDRLGESANATIRLHPDDYAATAAAQGDASGVVQVVADPMVRRGGCMVHSEFGLIDISADAQIQELATALLGNEEARDQRQTEASLVVA